MELGERLHRWWNRVLGRDEEPATASSQDLAAGKYTARETGPVATPSAASDELDLAVEGEPEGGPRHKSHPGTAGFDPYSSDAGYAKPHSWEDVSRK